MSELRSQQRRCADRSLVGALPVREIEDVIATDGAAKREAELLALEERIRVALVAVECGIGSQVMVAKEVEEVGVRLVAPGACDDVNCTGVGHAG